MRTLKLATGRADHHCALADKTAHDEPFYEGLCPGSEAGAKLLGCLRSTFGNFSPKANTLVRRLNRGVYRVCNRPRNTEAPL